ncbi:MAG: Lrp/AsnC family transcriptional regulator [Nanoarchaeota archaeon]
MLDKKDLKILYELDKDSRLTFSQLGRKVGLGKEATRYRVNRLVENKVIRKFATYLNFTRLGYLGYSVYCKYNSITDLRKEELKRYLQNHESVYWISELGGRFDLAFSLFAKDPLDFDRVLKNIINKYHSFLADITFIIKLEPHKYNRKYLIKLQPPADDEVVPAILGAYTPSLIEKKVLQSLTKNSRVTAADIADSINSPLSTVLYTIRKLVKNEIIAGSTIVPDVSLLGLESFQINISTSSSTSDEMASFFSYCKDHLNIIFAIKVLGSWNLELIYEIENAKLLQAAIAEIRSRFGHLIKDIEILNVFDDCLKLDHYPFRITG